MSSSAERDKRQVKVFTKWVNSHLKVRGKQIVDLAKDFTDGVNLCHLYEVISGKMLSKWVKEPKTQIQRTENLSIVVKEVNIFVKEIGIGLQYGPAQIEKGDVMQICGMLWILITKFVIPDNEEDKNKKRALLKWVQKCVGPGTLYNLKVEDFSKSFNDGVVLNALLHQFDSGCLSYPAVAEKPAKDRAKQALDVAEAMGIARLLDVEDIVTDVPDEKSMMMYVAIMYKHFHSNLGNALKKESDQYGVDAKKLSAWIDEQKAIYANQTFTCSRAEAEELEDGKLPKFLVLKNEYGKFKSKLQVQLASIQRRQKKERIKVYVPEDDVSLTTTHNKWLDLNDTLASYAQALRKYIMDLDEAKMKKEDEEERAREDEIRRKIEAEQKAREEGVRNALDEDAKKYEEDAKKLLEWVKKETEFHSNVGFTAPYDAALKMESDDFSKYLKEKAEYGRLRQKLAVRLATIQRRQAEEGAAAKWIQFPVYQPAVTTEGLTEVWENLEKTDKNYSFKLREYILGLEAEDYAAAAAKLVAWINESVEGHSNLAFTDGLEEAEKKEDVGLPNFNKVKGDKRRDKERLLLRLALIHRKQKEGGYALYVPNPELQGVWSNMELVMSKFAVALREYIISLQIKNFMIGFSEIVAWMEKNKGIYSNVAFAVGEIEEAVKLEDVELPAFLKEKNSMLLKKEALLIALANINRQQVEGKFAVFVPEVDIAAKWTELEGVVETYKVELRRYIISLEIAAYEADAKVVLEFVEKQTVVYANVAFKEAHGEAVALEEVAFPKFLKEKEATGVLREKVAVKLASIVRQQAEAKFAVYVPVVSVPEKWAEFESVLHNYKKKLREYILGLEAAEFASAATEWVAFVTDKIAFYKKVDFTEDHAAADKLEDEKLPAFLKVKNDFARQKDKLFNKLANIQRKQGEEKFAVYAPPAEISTETMIQKWTELDATLKAYAAALRYYILKHEYTEYMVEHESLLAWIAAKTGHYSKVAFSENHNDAEALLDGMSAMTKEKAEMMRQKNRLSEKLLSIQREMREGGFDVLIPAVAVQDKWNELDEILAQYVRALKLYIISLEIAAYEEEAKVVLAFVEKQSVVYSNVGFTASHPDAIALEEVAFPKFLKEKEAIGVIRDKVAIKLANIVRKQREGKFAEFVPVVSVPEKWTEFEAMLHNYQKKLREYILGLEAAEFASAATEWVAFVTDKIAFYKKVDFTEDHAAADKLEDEKLPAFLKVKNDFARQKDKLFNKLANIQRKQGEEQFAVYAPPAEISTETMIQKWTELDATLKAYAAALRYYILKHEYTEYMVEHESLLAWIKGKADHYSNVGFTESHKDADALLDGMSVMTKEKAEKMREKGRLFEKLMSLQREMREGSFEVLVPAVAIQDKWSELEDILAKYVKALKGYILGWMVKEYNVDHDELLAWITGKADHYSNVAFAGTALAAAIELLEVAYVAFLKEKSDKSIQKTKLGLRLGNINHKQKEDGFDVYVPAVDIGATWAKMDEIVAKWNVELKRYIVSLLIGEFEDAFKQLVAWIDEQKGYFGKAVFSCNHEEAQKLEEHELANYYKTEGEKAVLKEKLGVKLSLIGRKNKEGGFDVYTPPAEMEKLWDEMEAIVAKWYVALKQHMVDLQEADFKKEAKVLVAWIGEKKEYYAKTEFTMAHDEAVKVEEVDLPAFIKEKNVSAKTVETLSTNLAGIVRIQEREGFKVCVPEVDIVVEWSELEALVVKYALALRKYIQNLEETKLKGEEEENRKKEAEVFAKIEDDRKKREKARQEKKEEYDAKKAKLEDERTKLSAYDKKASNVMVWMFEKMKELSKDTIVKEDSELPAEEETDEETKNKRKAAVVECSQKMGEIKKELDNLGEWRSEATVDEGELKRNEAIMAYSLVNQEDAELEQLKSYVLPQ